MGDVITLKRPAELLPDDTSWVAPWAAEIAQGIVVNPDLCLTPEGIDHVTRRMEAFAVTVAESLQPFDYDTFADLMLVMFPDRLEVEIRLCRAGDWMPDCGDYFRR